MNTSRTTASRPASDADTAAPALWSAQRDPALQVRGWDDEDSGIAFDERSGDTFVLTPLAMELLAVLAESGPLPGDALVERLASGLAPPLPTTLARDADTELQRLHARGLVARILP